jgi:protein TonB
MDAVSEVLAGRAHEADRFTRMVIVSLALHAAVVSAIAFVRPGRDIAPDDRHIMQISLGGAPGPVQGRNPMSAKPVQEAVPETAKPKNDAPPALAKPEMIEPVKTAPVAPKAAVKPEPPKELPQLHSKTPTQGAEVKGGVARVETGSQSQTKFGGLATGGGGAGAAYTDYADFCCPEYLDQMVQMVQRNWQQKQGVDGAVGVKFTIQRDGTLTNVTVEKPATVPMLNMAAQRAVLNTRQLPPLPAAFTERTLTVHLNFTFIR